MKRLIQRQIDARVESLRPFVARSSGVPSWVRYVRKAYGMSLKQLAARAGLSVTAVQNIEKGEERQSVTLASLQKMAIALNCDFVYALVPRRSVSQIVNDQALLKARELMRLTQVQMEMEDQAVHPDEVAQQLRDLADQISQSKKLWS